MRRHLTVLAVAASATACGSYAHHSGRPFEASPVRVPHREPAEVSRDAPLPSVVAQAAAPVVVVTTTTTRPATTAEGTGWELSVTAYCQAGTMADGNETHAGAAAGNRWAFGTRLRVPGAGVVRIEDRVGWGSDLDVYMPSCAAAEQWGRRELWVEAA